MLECRVNLVTPIKESTACWTEQAVSADTVCALFQLLSVDVRWAAKLQMNLVRFKGDASKLELSCSQGTHNKYT